MLRPILATLALLLAAPVMAADAQPASPPASSPASPPAPPPGELLDRVVAVVNDGIVTQSELDDAQREAVSRLRQNNTQLPSADVVRRQVLDRLVLDEIQRQRADRIGIKVDDETVNGELGRLAEANNLTLAQLPEELARSGINYAAFRENMRHDIARQQLRRREVLNRVMSTITPREVDQFMERLKKMPDERAEYNWSHILIALPTDANKQQEDAARKLADEIVQRAASEDFAQLAVAYSSSQKALEGGAMGWVQGAQLPTFLAESIVALKPGEVSKPVAQSNGFHIVKLNAMRGSSGDPVQQQVHARHILLTANALQDDATVKQRLAGIRERVLAGEDFAAFASGISEDQGSAVNGGDLDWLGPGATVPEFEAEMARLKDGEISQPFKSQFGFHIVQVLGRRQFDTTQEQLRERAVVQLRESKADQELELWLRRLRDESFVETTLN